MKSESLKDTILKLKDRIIRTEAGNMQLSATDTRQGLINPLFRALQWDFGDFESIRSELRVPQFNEPVDYALGVALLRRRPRRLLRAARQELLDPSKAWWGGRRGRLADRRCCPISVSLGVVPLVLARFVEVPVRIEVAAGS